VTSFPAAGETAEVATPPPTGAAGVPVPGKPPARGWFDLASTSLAGLSAPFWIFEFYLFIGITLLDVEWKAIGALRPRLILGGLALTIALSRWFSGGAGRPAAARATPPPEHRYVLGWLVAFITAGLLCATWAYDTTLAWAFQLEHTTTMLAFFLMIAIVRTRREVLVTVLVFAAASGFYLLRSATEYWQGRHSFTMGVSRMMGAGDVDPNSFGGTIAFSLPLILWAAVRGRSRFLRFCVLCYGLLAAYCAIQTHSRSGFILLALNVFWAFAAIPSVKARIAIAVVLAGFGVYMVGFQSKNALERYASIFSSNTYEHESSTRGRIDGYRIAARMFEDRPLFGVGPGCWSLYRMQRIDGDKLMPHNMPGQLTATMGVAGVSTFVGYLLAVLSFGLSVRRRRAASPDPWDRAVSALAATVLFTLLLLLVSGTAAHNVDRSAWYLMPALLACAARAKAEPDAPRKVRR
jgi:O-antigen ligase